VHNDRGFCSSARIEILSPYPQESRFAVCGSYQKKGSPPLRLRVLRGNGKEQEKGRLSPAFFVKKYPAQPGSSAHTPPADTYTMVRAMRCMKRMKK
jgi:hypothetical protein